MEVQKCWMWASMGFASFEQEFSATCLEEEIMPQCNCVALPNIGSKKLGTEWKCPICGAVWIIRKNAIGLFWKKK